MFFPENVRDVILTVAEAGIFEVRWSPDVLDERERNLIKRAQVSPPNAARLRQTMERAFPDAMTLRSTYAYLVPSMPNQEKDRHVLAAAIASRSDVLVTANIKDFQLPMADGVIEVLHPDQFLCDQLDVACAPLLMSIGRSASQRCHPMNSVDALLKSLLKTVPNFADRAARAASGTGSESTGVALVSPTNTTPMVGD